MSKIAGPPTPQDLLITEALRRRPAGTPDLEAEVRAFHELSGLMATDPHSALQRFVEIALAVCDAGSAGISILDASAENGPVFRWDALAGRFSRYLGGTTPRHHSPCGLCLDRGETILLDRPARVFEYFRQAADPIAEGLVVPLYDTGRVPLGTIWVISHDDRRFDSNDARVLEQLAVQAVLAIKVVRSLTDERGRRIHAEKTANALRRTVAAKDMMIREVNHRVKNTLQMATSLLAVQAAAHGPEERAALTEAQARLDVLASIHELLYRNAENVQTVDMAALLDALVEALRASVVDRPDHVALELRSDDISLNPDFAIPLALIANEAITNACKYAYPGDMKGTVEVGFRRAEADSIELSVRDTGVGMPDNPRKGSLGVKLMRSLARQLGAALSFGEDGGTAVVVRFTPQAETQGAQAATASGQAA